MRLEGNKVIRVPGGATWGGSGASSVQTIPASTDGWVEGTITGLTTQRIFGLSDVDVDKTLNTIDYAFYLNHPWLADLDERGGFQHQR